MAQAGASDSAPTGASFPQVSVVTLKGAVHEGELRRLTTSTLVMKGPTGEQQFSYAELLQVDFDQPTRRPTPPKQQVQVVLVDGSRIDCENVNSFSANANLMSSLFGTVSLPRSAIASIRLEAFVRQRDHCMYGDSKKSDRCANSILFIAIRTRWPPTIPGFVSIRVYGLPGIPTKLGQTERI